MRMCVCMYVCVRTWPDTPMSSSPDRFNVTRIIGTDGAPLPMSLSQCVRCLSPMGHTHTHTHTSCNALLSWTSRGALRPACQQAYVCDCRLCMRCPSVCGSLGSIRGRHPRLLACNTRLSWTSRGALRPLGQHAYVCDCRLCMRCPSCLYGRAEKQWCAGNGGACTYRQSQTGLCTHSCCLMLSVKLAWVG